MPELNPSYEQVSQAFIDFQAPDAPEKRGGCPRHNLEPRKLVNYMHRPSVESSFNSEQLGYIQSTVAGLKRIANERVTPEDNNFFIESVCNHFFAEEVNPTFGRAVNKSILDIIYRFGERYHNLTPALYSMFEDAGIEGFRLVVLGSRIILDPILENAGRYDIYPKDVFSRLHTDIKDKSGKWAYEVWCSGIGLARMLIFDAEVAARLVAADKRTAERYTGEMTISELSVEVVSSLVDLKDRVCSRFIKDKEDYLARQRNFSISKVE